MKTDTKKVVGKAANKQSLPKTTALAKKAEPTGLASIEAIEGGMMRLWQAFSDGLMKLTPEQVPQALQFIKTTNKLSEDAEKLLKPMVIALVKATGKKTTDAGTMRATHSGYELEIQPNGSGSYIDKSVEALIRAKGLDVNSAMDAEVSYTTNTGKLDNLIQLKVITQAELDTCKKAESWKVMSPKKKES